MQECTIKRNLLFVRKLAVFLHLVKFPIWSDIREFILVKSHSSVSNAISPLLQAPTSNNIFKFMRIMSKEVDLALPAFLMAAANSTFIKAALKSTTWQVIKNYTNNYSLISRFRASASTYKRIKIPKARSLLMWYWARRYPTSFFKRDYSRLKCQ